MLHRSAGLADRDRLLSTTAGRRAPPPPGTEVTVPFPVYNMVPFEGVPSMVGFLTRSRRTDLHRRLDSIRSTSTSPSRSATSIADSRRPADHRLAPRLQRAGRERLPDPAHLDAEAAAGDAISSQVATPTPTPPEGAELMRQRRRPRRPPVRRGCGERPVQTDDRRHHRRWRKVDSPEADDCRRRDSVTTQREPIANSYLKTAKVTLPEGMGINPVFRQRPRALHRRAVRTKARTTPIACPAASKIGTVEVQTPSLPPNSLGRHRLRRPSRSKTDRAPRVPANSSGSSSTPPRSATGVNVRLIGKVFPNSDTGQLTAVVEDNPQATFSYFRLHLNGGPKGTLTPAEHLRPEQNDHGSDSVVGQPGPEHADERTSR